MIFSKKSKKDNLSMEKGVRMITVSQPTSVNTEQFNTIRTNIQFSNVDRDFKSIMITSATASDGKSTISANVAATFAKQGVKTLLVDADFRRPTFFATFGLPSTRGLTNYLTDRDVKLSSIIFKTTLDNLYIMPSGPTPPNPSELIGSNKMKRMIEQLSQQIDLVIYDAPPLLSVTDAQIMSSQVEGTVLVVRDNVTEKADVKSALELIEHVNGHVMGTILNDVENSSMGYYGYYGKEKK